MRFGSSISRSSRWRRRTRLTPGRLTPRCLRQKKHRFSQRCSRGVTLSFVCRYLECLFFGQNDGMTWPQEIGHYRFRCPSCGKKAAPWTTISGQIEGLAFVLMIIDPLTEEVTHIPTTWPPSQEEQWLNNMIELTARDIQSDADVEAWRNKSALDIHNLIQRERIPKAFKAIPWKPKNGHMLTKFRWKQIAERGFFYGDYLAKKEALGDLYSNWSELINLVANHVASTRALVAKI